MGLSKHRNQEGCVIHISYICLVISHLSLYLHKISNAISTVQKTSKCTTVNTWLMTMFTVFIVESGRKVHHIIQINNIDKSGKVRGWFSKGGSEKQRSFIWRYKWKASGRASGGESKGGVWGERGGGGGRRKHGGERLEGKRKGHVYETGVWHFKLSVLEVERHTHAHIYMQTHASPATSAIKRPCSLTDRSPCAVPLPACRWHCSTVKNETRKTNRFLAQ